MLFLITHYFKNEIMTVYSVALQRKKPQVTRATVTWMARGFKARSEVFSWGKHSPSVSRQKLHFTCRLKLQYKLSFQSFCHVYCVSCHTNYDISAVQYKKIKTAKQVQYYTVTDGLLMNLFSMLAKNIMKIILLRMTSLALFWWRNLPILIYSFIFFGCKGKKIWVGKKI